MDQVLTVIGDPASRALSPDQAEAARRCLRDCGAQTAAVDWLGPGIACDDVLLATLTLRGRTPGATVLAPGFDATDLSEGFPLAPTGFDTDVVLLDATVTVVPEPGIVGLLGVASCALVPIASRRRRAATTPRSCSASPCAGP